MAKEVCQECWAVFEAKSNRAFFCPKCRRARLSQYAKERKLNEIGNKAYSEQQAKRRVENV